MKNFIIFEFKDKISNEILNINITEFRADLTSDFDVSKIYYNYFCSMCVEFQKQNINIKDIDLYFCLFDQTLNKVSDIIYITSLYSFKKFENEEIIKENNEVAKEIEDFYKWKKEKQLIK